MQLLDLPDEDARKATKDRLGPSWTNFAETNIDACKATSTAKCDGRLQYILQKERVKMRRHKGMSQLRGSCGPLSSLVASSSGVACISGQGSHRASGQFACAVGRETLRRVSWDST